MERGREECVMRWKKREEGEGWGGVDEVGVVCSWCVSSVLCACG